VTSVSLVLLGQPCSKANSRELAIVGPVGAKRILVRKSDAAIKYEQDALRQIPSRARIQLQGPVRVWLRLYYMTEQPDLDESIVLDVLADRWSKGKGADRKLVQAGVYGNDRQVREKHVYHDIDKRNPRAEIVVESMAAQSLIPMPAPRADNPIVDLTTPPT